LRGVQQQWPSDTQQSIEQASDGSKASATGAEAHPTTSIARAIAARSLLRKFLWRAAVVIGKRYSITRFLRFNKYDV
jgi:hypothetical protein